MVLKYVLTQPEMGTLRLRVDNRVCSNNVLYKKKHM